MQRQGHQRQHHVARRYRHRDRRHGRCSDRHDRERAQAPGSGEAVTRAESLGDHARRPATEVGPPLFFSLLIITLSFLPVFALQAQEGRLFAPLAYTKTYAMAAAAGLSVTLVPVLMGYFIRGRIIAGSAQSASTACMIAAYRAAARSWCCTDPGSCCWSRCCWSLTGLWPAARLGTEFMPRPRRGRPAVHADHVARRSPSARPSRLLQQTDQLISTVPGGADACSARSAAPRRPPIRRRSTMFETTVRLKPREQWRPGMTMDKLKEELDRTVQIPGLSNAWVMPIKTRIDMLATGIKTPVGVKVAGPDLDVIETHRQAASRRWSRPCPGTVSVYSERVAGGSLRRPSISIALARGALRAQHRRCPGRWCAPRSAA